MEETAAEADPLMEPNSMQASVQTYESPALRLPTTAVANSISRRAMPPSLISIPGDDETRNGKQRKAGDTRTHAMRDDAIGWHIAERQ